MPQGLGLSPTEAVNHRSNQTLAAKPKSVMVLGSNPEEAGNNSTEGLTSPFESAQNCPAVAASTGKQCQAFMAGCELQFYSII